MPQPARTLPAAFKLRDNMDHHLERPHAYARMGRDEDNTKPCYQVLEELAVQGRYGCQRLALQPGGVAAERRGDGPGGA